MRNRLMCGGYTRPSCGRSSKRWAKARGSHRANYGEESRPNVLRGPALRLCRNRPGRQRCGSNVDNAHAESERRRNITSAATAAMTNVRMAIVSLISIAIPPVELGRKGEYEPQCARREK